MNKELMFSSKNHEWETPDDLFKMLDMEFNFVRDLAADKNNTKCYDFFSHTLDEYHRGGIPCDSLKQDWAEGFGFAYQWLNPPYGREVKDWVKKCDEEAQKGAKIVALLPARTDTKWFHDRIYRKYEVRFLKGRLKFKLNGEPQDSAPFPSMVVIFEKKTNENEK